ncbi:uncharacterized protein A1O9_04470 [Exophiala aquamarina CBS 119918]|uniref:Transcription factor domain-containing protein n=1 Tax=Exophiala aquamarina CBS 119918 TaxID=1182545 RepID=A0A072PHK4_9EURO|nr:uncharacterized protein A1O9_04470 [Exophiala aquamarina CBS 119918]KEF59624.1 hypothetical protein A1O9_04470 [Exophiala aquamarina CBS 119918]
MFRVESPSSFADGVKRDGRRKRRTPADESTSRRPSSDSAMTTGNDLSGISSNSAARRSLTRSPLDEYVVNFIGWYLSRSTQLSECWDDHAMVLGFSTVSCAQRHPDIKGLLVPLQDMIRDATPDSAVILTCQAIGNAFLTSKVSSVEAWSKRRAAYGRALTATNAALQDPILQVEDQTLAAVWLLGIYELIASPAGGSPPIGYAPQNHGSEPWMVHTQGLATLLRLRGTSQFTSPTARALFWLVYNTVQIRCFIAGIASPPESTTWFQVLEQDLRVQESATFRICVYGHRTSTLCAKVRQFLLHGSSRSSNTAAELLAEANQLELEMRQSWEDDGEEFDAEGPRDGYSLRQLACRTFFYSFRLKFQLTLVELLSKVRVETHESESALLQSQLQLRIANVQNAADEILACVSVVFSTEVAPRTTGRLRPRLWTDGVRMLWPLRLIALWRGPREDQTVVARKLLYQMREELGIRHDSVPVLPSASLLVPVTS